MIYYWLGVLAYLILGLGFRYWTESEFRKELSKKQCNWLIVGWLPLLFVGFVAGLFVELKFLAIKRKYRKG